MEKEESQEKDKAKIFNLEFLKNKFISSFLPTTTLHARSLSKLTFIENKKLNLVPILIKIRLSYEGQKSVK